MWPVTRLILLSCLISVPGYGQVQRALLIGINHYTPPAGYTAPGTSGRSEFRDLDGCRNDALAIYSLITTKFGFQEKDVDTLFDGSATRQGILTSLERLLSASRAGDIAFVYYAGHGSEIRNSLSFEVDKKDQTIVPSDAWKEGVADIRDKELSAIFNRFLDKKIRLTVIFDCCHSGSISRGPNVSPDRSRYLPMADGDSRDSSRYPVPELREGNNFLIFSAAQSNEIASEQTDDQGIHHGAFTVALTEAINQQSAEASAMDIFTAARAILKSNGKNQEPVIGGSEVRQKESLFGTKKSDLPAYAYIAVTGVTRNHVLLQGGLALGLARDNELSMIDDHHDTIFKLRIDTVLNITRSMASVVKGDIREIKPGSLFRVTNWVSSGKPSIKIYIPHSTLSSEDVRNFTRVAVELKHSARVRWVPFIGKGQPDPYTSVFWVGDKCFVKVDQEPAAALKTVTTQAILRYCRKDSSLYVELPVSSENVRQYSSRLSQNRNVQLVDSINLSNYLLFGRLGVHDYPAYGFRRTEIAAADSLESMPVETDCYEAGTATSGTQPDRVADSLFETAMRLSKLWGWLHLSGPNTGKNGFPYHLELFNDDRKLSIGNGSYHIGDHISVRLVANDDYSGYQGGPKYVYVFGIDQSGAMQLYFPGDDGNVTNKYPKFDNGELVKDVTLLSGTVPPPSGTDLYFLLACDEPIQNATQVFNQEGVYSGITSRGLANDSNPLSTLLDMGNAGSRGIPGKLSATWSIQRFSFKCMY